MLEIDPKPVFLLYAQIPSSASIAPKRPFEACVAAKPALNQVDWFPSLTDESDMETDSVPVSSPPRKVTTKKKRAATTKKKDAKSGTASRQLKYVIIVIT